MMKFFWQLEIFNQRRFARSANIKIIISDICVGTTAVTDWRQQAVDEPFVGTAWEDVIDDLRNHAGK